MGQFLAIRLHSHPRVRERAPLRGERVCLSANARSGGQRPPLQKTCAALVAAISDRRRAALCRFGGQRPLLQDACGALVAAISDRRRVAFCRFGGQRPPLQDACGALVAGGGR